MGYETELVVGKLTDHKFGHETAHWFKVYAVVDMCKMGYDTLVATLDAHLPKGSEPAVYWYAPTGDGNTMITEDSYGDMPKPLPIKTVVEALEKDMENEDYRRFKWALALLKSMEDDPEGLSVLMWGY